MSKKELTNYKENLTKIIDSIDFSEINSLSEKILKIWSEKKKVIYLWKWWKCRKCNPHCK